jgi:hypothetical protein
VRGRGEGENNEGEDDKRVGARDVLGVGEGVEGGDEVEVDEGEDPASTRVRLARPGRKVRRGDEPKKRQQRDPVLEPDLVVLVKHEEPDGREETDDEGPDEGGDDLVADERLEGDVAVVTGVGEPGVGGGDEEGDEELRGRQGSVRSPTEGRQKGQAEKETGTNNRENETGGVAVEGRAPVSIPAH